MCRGSNFSKIKGTGQNLDLKKKPIIYLIENKITIALLIAIIVVLAIMLKRIRDDKKKETSQNLTPEQMDETLPEKTREAVELEKSVTAESVETEGESIE